MEQGWDEAWDALGGLLFIALTALVVGFFIALFLGGAWLIRLLKEEGRSGGAADAPPAPLFGAPPEGRWLMAYDYWLFQLEQMTGIELNTSPARLLVGCILISAGPAVLLGAVLDWVDPGAGHAWMMGLGLLGVCIGLISGRLEAGPAIGWFDAPSGSHGSHRRSGYLDLGEDEE